MKGLENKIIMVTGAGSGIGRAAAIYLSKEKNKVILADINLEACEAVAQEIREADDSSEVMCVKINVTDKNSIHEAVCRVKEKYEKIDGLAHCAGVISNAPFEEIAQKDVDFLIDVNLKGTLYVMQEVGKQMLAQGSGKIAVLASKAGKIGTPTLAHYTASKFGVIGLVQTAAMEWGRRGVYVNCICPGEVDTPMLRKSYEKICQVEGISMEEQVRRGNEMSLVGRLTPPENLAKIISFLLSQDSDEIIGQAINTDGGIVFH